MTEAVEERSRTHVISELGLTVRLEGEQLHGRAAVVPEMHVPGTDYLRTSVLAAWTDTLTGILSIGVISPRVPVTLDLSVELQQLPRACTDVTGTARIVKAGRSVVVTEVDFFADGEPLAVAMASFMPTRDPAPSLPSLEETVAMHHSVRGRLTQPFAERAGVERASRGVATVERSNDGLNATNTINGGVIGLVIEEAALSATPGQTLSSLAIRYLRPARVGPIVATADRHRPTSALMRVEVRDTGSDNRLVAVATARCAG